MIGGGVGPSRVYGWLVRAQGDEAEGIDDAAAPHLASNGLRQVAAQSLQGIGDQVVNAKTVLPWLLSSAGAPGFFLALLVPIRESGSMLPQAALTPWLERRRARKWGWVAGAAGQAIGAAAMAVVTATTEGWVTGVGIVVSLALFALARALCSLASKDVMGRTVPKGQRGQINGMVTVLSGIVALTLGVALQVQGDSVDATELAWLLAGAALAWCGGLVAFATVREPVGEAGPGGEASNWWRASWQLLREDATFRRFVVVRALLLVSALSPPFVVAIGVANHGAGLSGLGLFVMAQGVASLAGGRIFGVWSDRSSRELMVWCAVAASATIIAFLVLLRFETLREGDWLYPATYLLLAVVHLGTRTARKTYVVDIAEGDTRTEYVAVANTAMGVLLLAAGAVTGVLSHWGNEGALVLLAALGIVGALAGRRLPEVSAGR